MAHRYDYPSGGKGDTRIMPQVSEEEFARRWAATFGQNAPHDTTRTHGSGLDDGDDDRGDPTRYHRVDVGGEEGIGGAGTVGSTGPEAGGDPTTTGDQG